MKIVELSNAPSFPIWFDGILMLLSAVIPAGQLLDKALKRISLSRKLPMLTRDVFIRPGGPAGRGRLAKAWNTIALLDDKELKAVMARQIRREMRDKAKSAERWLAVAREFRQEMEGSLRSIVYTGAKAATDPLFTKNDISEWIKTNQMPKKADTTGLPAVKVFKGFLHWIRISKVSDEEILAELTERVKTSDDEEWLKSFPDYLELEESGTSWSSAHKTFYGGGPDEIFQRFVEACFWCTTYDLTPGPSKRTSLLDQPNFDLFPFPKAFWDYLVERHYDPFTGQTYKDVGEVDWIATEGAYYHRPDFPYLNKYTPQVRLSIHWSMILAPDLLRMNQDLTSTLAKYLPPPPP
jgi:hypothetical protein